MSQFGDDQPDDSAVKQRRLYGNQHENGHEVDDLQIYEDEDGQKVDDLETDLLETEPSIRRLHRRTRSTSDMSIQRINIPGRVNSSKLTIVTKAHYTSLPESPAVSFLSQMAFEDDMAGRLDFTEGTIVAGYQVGEVVGRGTFSECRVAIALANNERFAMKIIQPMQSESSEVMMECGREVSVWRGLEHPNILPLVECFFIDGACVCVMPLCELGNLKDYLSNNGSLDEKTAKLLFRKILGAVHYLHQNGLVHRDIKLENVLLDHEMNPYLCDFGLTESVELSNRKPLEHKGTPEYVCPEIINKSKSVDLRKADVWALGVALYAMVCGELPFQHEFTPKLYQNIVTRQVAPISKEFSPELHALIESILEKDPEKRPLTESILSSRWFQI